MTGLKPPALFFALSLFIFTGPAEAGPARAAAGNDSLLSGAVKRDGALADSLAVPGKQIVIQVRKTAGPITIDGVLDDPAWSEALPYCDYFFQQEPLDRAPSSEKTEVRVLQDLNNIYFGVQCYESDPRKIFATAKRRDGNFLNDDALELLIDTFHDLRNSYAFGTNPFGVQVDAIISDEGNHINKSWDCIWYCKSKINSRGWALEMAIPFKSLKYKPGESLVWGLNITREIKHSKEVTYLVPIPRGLGHNGKFKGSLFAELRNIQPPPPGLNLEVQPYLTAGKTWSYQTDEFKSNTDGGLDLRYHFTPQLAADLSYQTDFAQAESEQEVVNLTRFNINLPEKREFFLESAGLFNFGSSISAGGTVVGAREQSEFKLFESRTIGIRDGRRIPLFGGAKLAGRLGQLSLGAMNLQSEETRLDESTVEPSENYTAIRLKRDFRTNSNIGLMVLNKQSSDASYSRAVGADAFFAFTPEIIVNGSLAKSFVPGIHNRDWAGDLGAILNKDWIDLSLRYTQVDSLFNPEMGFVRRGNLRSSDGTLALTKWINNSYLKSVSVINDIQYQTDNHNTLLYRENRLDFQFTLKSEDFFSYSIHRLYEYLPSDDYIREILIGRGGDIGHHQHLTFRSYKARRSAGSITYRWGDLLDGKTSTFTLSNITQITNSLNLDLAYSYETLNLRNGTINANTLSGRWTYSFTTDLFAKYYLQWNDADHRLAANLLIDYIYKPRCHIYLVFNENRDTTLQLGSRKMKERLILLKLTYLWSV